MASKRAHYQHEYRKRTKQMRELLADQSSEDELFYVPPAVPQIVRGNNCDTTDDVNRYTDALQSTAAARDTVDEPLSMRTIRTRGHRKIYGRCRNSLVNYNTTDSSGSLGMVV